MLDYKLLIGYKPKEEPYDEDKWALKIYNSISESILFPCRIVFNDVIDTMSNEKVGVIAYIETTKEKAEKYLKHNNLVIDEVIEGIHIIKADKESD